MEEMNNQVMENTMTEVVEGVTDKMTFKENLAAYGLATVFGIGVVTVGYLGFKGVKNIARKIKDKKEYQEESKNETVVDVEENEIHEVKNDDSEEN